MLVLDEPTNDLDIESLELLEQTLQDYPGTLLLVSHDRAFLDNVVTQTLAPHGDGQLARVRRRLQRLDRAAPAPVAARATPRTGDAARTVADSATPAKRTVVRPAKLSYRESRELELLPQQIETFEAEQQALHARMADAGYHQAGREALKADRERMLEIERELATAYERWAELDARVSAAR